MKQLNIKIIYIILCYNATKQLNRIVINNTIGY